MWRRVGLPPFGRHHSLGLDLAGGEDLSRSFEPCLSITSLFQDTLKLTGISVSGVNVVIHV